MLYQWIALDQIAHATGSRCLAGTSAGNRSWRALLRRIAEGELIVSQRTISKGVEYGDPPKPDKKPEVIGPPVMRTVGRPIPQDRKPIPAPAHWALIEKTALTQPNGNEKNGHHEMDAPTPRCH